MHELENTAAAWVRHAWTWANDSVDHTAPHAMAINTPADRSHEDAAPAGDQTAAEGQEAPGLAAEVEPSERRAT